MEVIVNENKSDKKKYPYLGIFNNGTIVFFINPKGGFCLYSGDGCLHSKGRYSENWAENECKKFEGEIILRN